MHHPQIRARRHLKQALRLIFSLSRIWPLDQTTYEAMSLRLLNLDRLSHRHMPVARVPMIIST